MPDFDEQSLARYLTHCFESTSLDELHFKQNDTTTLNVKKITGSGVTSSPQVVQVSYIDRHGTLLSTTKTNVDNASEVIDVPKDSYAFISSMRYEGLYYEFYQKEDLQKLIQVVRERPNIDINLKLHAARLIFVNLIRG